jgi:hypothetical protein
MEIAREPDKVPIQVRIREFNHEVMNLPERIIQNDLSGFISWPLDVAMMGRDVTSSCMRHITV